MRYREMLAAAEAADACEDTITELKKYTSIAEAMTDTKAPMWACWYALKVIKGRWPEMEAIIATSPEWACYYARHIIKSRWPEVETVIATDPLQAYKYARDIFKGRWPEAEAVIATDSTWACEYKRLTKGGTP